LVHTKLRNQIGYEKLHKLVYVHYYLKLCIQEFETDFQSHQEKDIDPYSVMMGTALYDEFDEDGDDWKVWAPFSKKNASFVSVEKV
jgi:hypothetical protein